MRFFDMHCDTATECAFNFGGRSLSEGAFHLSLKRGAYIDSWAQVFAVFIPDELRGQSAIDYYERARDYIYSQQKVCEGKFYLCKSTEDIDKYAGKGRCAAILSVEGGAALAGDISRVEALHNDGVRLITLTWNGPNELGDGNMTENAGGLTAFGKDVVAKMNELGMAVDVSHLSDKGFYDVAEITKAPITASHSCSRRLCKHSRNLTDEMFCVIRDTKGAVGINFCTKFLHEDEYAADMTDILRHTEYYLSLGGDNTVCIGSDFDGTDMPKGVTGVESMGELYELFLRHNYSEDTVRKIFWDNAYSFWGRVTDFSRAINKSTNLKG
ncbi:MAG: dipeptidase [Oscillospiraceae bacterium]|jgi:membrane dipeptidase|nr:dipeptidase [Oscillospiraceae bacterium]